MDDKITFTCEKCDKEVSTDGPIGTKNRNHCPLCLWSKHVDLNVSGDRCADCHGLMKPIALTFKNEGLDKYGNKKQGELMIIHQCMKCYDISINRIAADDDNKKIMKLYEDSQKLNTETIKSLQEKNILILSDKDQLEIKRQLFGQI